MTDRPRPFGPKTPDHPAVGEDCPACHVPFAAGDWTALVALGPGGDPEQQARALAGRPFNAVALEVHWACHTGAPDPPPDCDREGGCGMCRADARDWPAGVPPFCPYFPSLPPLGGS